AAQYDDVGIEDVDDEREGASQPLEVALERRAVARGDVAGAELFSSHALVIAFEPGARKVSLDAAQAGAVATRQRQVVGRRQRQRVVSPFAGDRVAPDEHLALDDDAGTDAGAEDHAEDHRRSGTG